MRRRSSSLGARGAGCQRVVMGQCPGAGSRRRTFSACNICVRVPSAIGGRPDKAAYRATPEKCPPGPHTQETGHSGVGGIRGVQIHLVGMESRRRDGQVAAQPVDVLHKRHVHLQRPLPRGLVRVADIDAGAPGGQKGKVGRGCRSPPGPRPAPGALCKMARPPGHYEEGGENGPPGSGFL